MKLSLSILIGENPNFGQLMMDTIRRTLILAAALALNCFTDGSTSLERVFLSQLVISKKEKIFQSFIDILKLLNKINLI